MLAMVPHAARASVQASYSPAFFLEMEERNRKGMLAYYGGNVR
jgi:hypothetical protein